MNEAKFCKFMAMLQQLIINVPLVEALEQMPDYAKFMKNLVTKKQKVSHEPKDNLFHCVSISTRSFVQKKADPSAFTILCTIGSLNFTKELCDMGDNINLIPLVVYKKIGLGDLTLTNMQLVMADKSVKRPMGILHDVLHKVADFILSADFVVLDCEMDFEVPIILGRPFLATGRVIVDIELNELEFRLNDKEARFEIHSFMTQ
ncbi:uncharacterized protein LOC107841654 [Capsicum annuum]|uniref:uncharacterized protein LOC107841654 n=1 Tax=Capsicum annuum TaxID=4072 RepID=UPI0007BFA83B|nr:uncharacterized protein LOC107841654 [Capsicum annuum]